MSAYISESDIRAASDRTGLALIDLISELSAVDVQRIPPDSSTTLHEIDPRDHQHTLASCRREIKTLVNLELLSAVTFQFPTSRIGE